MIKTMICLLACALAGAAVAAPVGATDEVAVIETKFGRMVIEFFGADAPKTVANFKKLAGEKFYDGTTFHRVVKDFMIQGGDPLSRDPKNQYLGSGGPGYKVKAEFNKNHHVLGVVSMARADHPDSAGSQFFVCLDDCRDSLDGQYTAFGRLIEGVEVLKKIGSLPTKMDRSGQEKSVPEERVVMTKVSIMPRADALKKN